MSIENEFWWVKEKDWITDRMPEDVLLDGKTGHRKYLWVLATDGEKVYIAIRTQVSKGVWMWNSHRVRKWAILP